MKDSANYYDPEVWQICKTCWIIYIDQLDTIEIIRETSISRFFIRFFIIIKKHKLIPNYRFDFLRKHAIIEQIYINYQKYK